MASFSAWFSWHITTVLSEVVTSVAIIFFRKWHSSLPSLASVHKHTYTQADRHLFTRLICPLPFSAILNIRVYLKQGTAYTVTNICCSACVLLQQSVWTLSISHLFQSVWFPSPPHHTVWDSSLLSRRQDFMATLTVLFLHFQTQKHSKGKHSN